MSDEQTLVFRFNDNGQGPDIVQQVLLERGWVAFDEEIHQDHEWNMWWKASRFKASHHDQLLPWQRINHYPKTTALTTKDNLARNLKRMKGIYGANSYNFSPLCYNLPNDYKKFVADYTRRKQKDPNSLQLWICKPADMSRGRGIFIFRDLSELQYDCSAVLQKYLTNPFLIAGYKLDLRIYVCVTSFHPLSIYIYQEGLVRFSTEKFDLNNLSNVYSHLTNTSINKFGPSYATDKERVGSGCKWTITQLRHYFRQNEIDDRLLWCRITSLVTLTILAQADQVPKAQNCFEMYGFDIIIDENMKPWLLEVNFSPALGMDCTADVLTKKPMLHDLFNLLNYSPTDCHRGGDNFVFSPANKAAHYFRATHRPPIARPKKNSVSVTGNGKVPKPKARTEEINGTNVKETVSDAEADDEEAVERLVPGCGLPSVQMLKSRQSVSNSSGCSSAGSFDVNSGAQNRSNQTKSPSCRSPSKKRSSDTAIRESRAKDNSASSRKGKRNSSCYSKENSTVSDSAVSGLSSDNSDDDCDDANVKVSEVKLGRNNVLSNSVGTMHSCYTKHASSIYAASNATKSFVSPYTVQKSPFTKQNSLNSRGRKMSEPGHQVSRPPPLVRRNTQPTSLSPGQKPKQGLLPQRQKVSNGLSPVSSVSLSRRSFSNTNNTHLAAPVGNLNNVLYPTMQQRVGDYFMIYPFNDQTRRMKTSLEIRTAVHEIQRLIKAKMNEVKGLQSEKVSDVPLIWAPLVGASEEQPQSSETSGMFGSLNMKSQG